MDDWVIITLKWIGQVALTIAATVTAVVRWLNGRVTRLEDNHTKHGERIRALEVQHEDKVKRLERIERAIEITRDEMLQQFEKVTDRMQRYFSRKE